MLESKTRRDVLMTGAAVIAITAVSDSVAQVAQTGAGLGAPTSTSGFTPASLTNLIGWYKADVGITSCAAGIVSAVADQSTRGNNLTTVVSVSTHDFVGISSVGYTGSLGNKFAFLLDSAGGNNSGAMLTGNSTTGNITLPLSSVFTFWAIGQVSSLSPGFGRLAILGGSTGTDSVSAGLPAFLINDGSSTVISGYQNLFAFSSLAHGTNHRFITTCDGSSIYLYIDNTFLASQQAPLNCSFPVNLIFGSGWSNGALDFNGITGNFCELGIAISFSGSATVAQLDSYLVGKWGS